MKYLISTDLDGTLLDHYNYSWEAAQQALKVCLEQKVPVILNTSKTLSEGRKLQEEIGIQAPMIVENGSSLILPLISCGRQIDIDYLDKQMLEYDSDDERKEIQVLFGTARYELLQFIDQIRKQYSWQFAGFNDWSIEETVERTDLDKQAAHRAKDKRYSEPLIWNDSKEALSQFTALAAQRDFKLLRGGRFFHLQGNTDKGVPLNWLRENITRLYPLLANESGIPDPELICLGDNHNDVEMLNIADYPVCVRSPVTEFPQLTTEKRVIFTKEEGPKGWNKAVLEIIAH